MDPINIEKIQAMRKYKKTHFLQTLTFQYILKALVLIMGFSKVLWIPSSLFSSMKLFFFVSLPNICAFIVDPKCLFVIGNVIVIFLISESKFSRPSSTSPDIYDEYVRRSQNLQKQSFTGEKEKVKRLEVSSNEGDEKIIKQVEEEEEKEKRGEEKEEKGGEKLEEEEEEEEEEEKGMELMNLNRRSEEFIASVIKKWRLESKMSACSD